MNRSRSGSVKRGKPDTSRDSSDTRPSRPQEKKGRKDSSKKGQSSTILTHFGGREEMKEIDSDRPTPRKNSTASESGSVKCSGDSENTECSNRDLMKLLRKMDGKLDSLSQTVERMQGEIFDLQEENQTLRREIELCKKKQEEHEREVIEAVYLSKLAAEKANRNEQYSRSNNLKFLFVDEHMERDESAEESEKKVLSIIHDKLKLRHVKPADLEAVHRIGTKHRSRQQNQPGRPIIVRFLSRKIRDEVISNRRNLKNSTPKIAIVEDLTKTTYNLYRAAADTPGAAQTWTSRGRVYLKDTYGKIHKIEKLTDLRNVPEPDPNHSLSKRMTSTPSGNRSSIWDPKPPPRKK